MKILDVLYEVVSIALIFIVGILIAILIPVPSSLISMFIFFMLLHFRVLKEEKYKNLTKIILMHLAFFFIPPAVKIMASTEILSGNILKLVAVLVLSNIMVMGVTGTVVQYFVQKESNTKESGTND